MELQYILISIFVLISFIGLWHFIKMPVNQSNIFLGLFIMFFALSIIHILNVKYFFHTKYNPLILIPFNLIFFPVYFLMRYFDKFLFYPVFKPAFEKSVLIIAFVELSTNLLPLGAWIYTGKFDLQLISFIFGIKRFFVFALLPVGISVLVILSKSITKYKSKTNDDTLRIRWVKEFIFLLLVLILIIVLPEVAYYFKFRSYSLFVIQSFVGAAIIAFIGLRNLNIQVVSAIETARETNSYNPEISLSYNQIKHLFDNEKIYCNSELRISDVAERISLSPNYVSKIINEKAKAGFNDFVNQYRVNHVIELLKKREYVRKNIFALAQDAGFNSKSTFQSGFKKFTGKTPSQFIKEFEGQ